MSVSQRRICVIDAHPDPEPERFVHALAAAYVAGATTAGHSVETIEIAHLPVSILSTSADFATPPDEPVLSERAKLVVADHVVILFPLWLGMMPAKAKAFLEQVARGGFLLDEPAEKGQWPKRLMAGRSARVIVTMGMPEAVFGLLMDAGELKAVERGFLGMVGFWPLHHTVIGGVDASAERRAKWLEEVRKLGEKAA